MVIYANEQCINQNSGRKWGKKEEKVAYVLNFMLKILLHFSHRV